MDIQVDKTQRIRELNDALRRTFLGGQVKSNRAARPDSRCSRPRARCRIAG